ncbi:NADH dehydrogenase (ubiquinone) 1 beta subcomplex subunit 2 [Sarotherodon galilaeus]
MVVTVLIVILVMVCCCCCCLAYVENHEVEYGNRFRMRVSRRVHFIEFIPKNKSEGTILWNRDEAPPREGSRWKMIGTLYTINSLAPKDSGRYIFKDSYGELMHAKIIDVKEVTKSYTLETNEVLNITFDLEPHSCNIYFFPGENSKTAIVLKGRLQHDLKQVDCVGFELLKPCGIVHKAIQKTCIGRFEVRDDNDDKALVVFLEMEEPQFSPTYLGIGGGALFVTLCWCCCKHCCCGESSSAKDNSEAAEENDSEPAVYYHEFEPVGPGPNQRCELSNPPNTEEAPDAPVGPMIHSSAAMDAPPAYREVTPLVKQEEAPTITPNSDAEPRFELKGTVFNSGAPLSSSSTYCDVYTSEKINFL